VYDSLKKADEPADPMTDWIVGQGRALDRDEIIALVARRDRYRMAVAAHWQKAGIHCLLSPVGPTPAPQPLTAKYWNYTSYWNLANYPAGVFPTGLFVDKNDKKDSYQPRNDKEKEIYATYDPAVAEGAPLCLQVVGYIGLEEETLDSMKKIVDAVSK
jgi:amidase